MSKITMPIKIDYEFRDMIICALRYALPRHTYVVDEVCSWIEKHPTILDQRMINVMLKDVKEQLRFYNKNGVDSISEIDFKRLKSFYYWLEDIINAS